MVDRECKRGVAADIQGNAYVTGVTFPEVLDPYGSISGGTDAIVVKINPLGTALNTSIISGVKVGMMPETP